MLWHLKNLDLVFVTCQREPFLLPITLASAFLADASTSELKNIHVVVDAPDLAWIGPLTQNRKIRWSSRTDEQNLLSSGSSLHQRASYNYWRALQSMAADSQGLIIFEDDVIFKDGWLRMLLAALNEMQQDGLDAFVLALYSPHDHEDNSFRRGKFYSSYFAACFYGTQGMFFPATQLPAVSQVVFSESAQTFRMPYDLAINQYCTAQQNLYTTRNSLVQHIGSVSTGLGAGQHTSPSFDRSWPNSSGD